MPHWVEIALPYLSSAVALVLSILASAHAVLNKRDLRATIGWVAVVWLVPGIGAVLYVLLGINRIRRKALALREGRPRYNRLSSAPLPSSDEGGPRLPELVQLVDRFCARPLVAGNSITPLVDGDAAYPEMISAIESATKSVTLMTYIFDNDPIGRKFVDALAAAHARGVEVRVLIDDAGIRYSWWPVDRQLRRRGVRVRRFLPAWLLRRAAYFNLRNHRKILVIDGRIGFTGGMNIRQGHVIVSGAKHPTQDLHFKLEGPVVSQLQEVFAEDWQYTTREALQGEVWFPELEPTGTTCARGIADGPDESMDQLQLALAGAIACARRSIRIMTPYFLPDATLATALNIAALRGVAVDIVLPGRNNIVLVQWAMYALLPQVLSYGCRVWLTPPPFDHTKLMVVDEHWVLFGSTNWDPRSLRLNFEFSVEAYDDRLAAHCADLVTSRIEKSSRITSTNLEARSLFTRLRDGIARLLTPYL